MYTVRALWEGQVLDSTHFTGEEEPRAEQFYEALVGLAEAMKLDGGTTVQFIKGDDVLYEKHVA